MKSRADGAGEAIQSRGERLPERDLIALYNMGRVLKLKPGENLVPGYEKGTGVFFVIRGLLRVYREGEGHRNEKTMFDNFDWLTPGVVGTDSPTGYRIAAEEPSQVLALAESTLTSLDPPLLNHILRKVNESCVRRLRGIEEEVAHAAAVNGFLSGAILGARARHRAGYESSELISALLRNLPRLPAYSIQLVRMLEHEGAPHREVTRLLKEDPSLVSEVLKTVNSPYYGLQKKVSDLNYAVLYLGFEQIYQLLVSSGLRRIMPDTDDFQELHRHSVVLSHLAHEICQFHDRRKSAVVGTIALLHDIGKSVTLLLRVQNPKWAFFIDMLDTARMGAMLLKEWSIPPMVYECIDSQDLPEFMPPYLMDPHLRDGVAVLYAAHAACDLIEGRAGILRHPFLEDIRELLQLPGDSFQDFVAGHLLRELNGKLHTLPQHLRDLLTGA